ncbi:hypothetical protein OSB04_011396 [Centaurea solstitialis]|uniref:SWIM-type domain-containing protein n=1 Tax=Centaurea solstitialis TaxID=347529 RepID=A0AA38TSF5_9ASTR|nr:hypothetical protein OSB04_011396 [Centaurea solstitialis]
MEQNNDFLPLSSGVDHEVGDVDDAVGGITKYGTSLLSVDNNESEIVETGTMNDVDADLVFDSNHHDGEGELDDLCSEVVEHPDGTMGWLPVVVEPHKPKIGDRYDSYDVAESMYRSYAFKAGFDVRLNARKMNREGCIQTRWFVCSKEGNPQNKVIDSMDVGLSERRGRNSNFKRSGCFACMKIHLTKDKMGYEVYEFVEIHNHVLFNHNDRRFSKGNRQMQYTDFVSVLRSSKNKVGPTKAYRHQSVLKGGFDKMRCTIVDYQNFKRDVGLYVGKKDAKMLVSKMFNRKDIRNDFFFEYKCDNKVLHAIFWADEIAQVNYREFGDVISFDATYRSNEHAMVFVPFLAVDNHKRSVVVGASLIAGENAINFEWAVPSVFTESKHRLCMWYIMDKIPRKVSMELNRNPNFNALIKKLVWNVHISPEEFEEQWERMVNEFGLAKDKWFIKMFRIRHSWIPAFYKDTPMSGLMKTTSRSESANAFFNLYSSFESDLVEFYMNYDSAIEKQCELHAANEYVTRTTLPQFISPFDIEVHTAKVYTRTLFFDFQKELKKAMWFCGIDGVKEEGHDKVYYIMHQNKSREVKKLYKVNHNPVDNTVDCECNFFVRNGYLCRHALKVLINSQVDRLPDKYVLRRWTRELVPTHFQTAAVRYGEVDSEKEKLMTEMYSNMDDVASRVRNDKDEMIKFNKYLADYKVQLSTRLPNDDVAQQKVDAITEHFGVPVPEDVDIYSPTGLTNKGCAFGKRLRSKKEIMKSGHKKSKCKCKKCGEANGHDSRNCPLIASKSA